MADGTLFIFDLKNRKIVATHRVVKVNYDSKNIWRDAFLVVHPSGQVYGVASGQFFRIDPATWHVTILRNHGIELLAMDRGGTLYFHEGINLWQYLP